MPKVEGEFEKLTWGGWLRREQVWARMDINRVL